MERKNSTYFGELGAMQIKIPCPDCKEEVVSWKNWAMKGKGQHLIRTYQFRCPMCGLSYRHTRKIKIEEIEIE